MPFKLFNFKNLATVLWLTGITAGSYAMLRHEFDGRTASGAPEQWPAELGDFNPSESDLTLVMAVHPDCPCTRASIEQLDRILTQNPGQCQAIALVYTSEGDDATSIKEGAYWRRLASLPEVRPQLDPEGHFAIKLGSGISGTVAAYDRKGVLRFQGGLTPSRGHGGPSVAVTTINRILKGESNELAAAPTFGCSIDGSDLLP